MTLGDRTVTPVFVLAGGATPEGVLVHSTLEPADTGASVNLAVWRADGTGERWFAGSEVADDDAIVRHVVTGREPDTAYYAQLSLDGHLLGERIRFVTLPAPGSSWTRAIGVVSCQDNASDPVSTDIAWADLRAWQPDDIWHLGDWGYWGGFIPPHASYKRDLFHYARSMTMQPTMRQAIQAAGLNVVTISDHELTDNGDPPGGMHNAPQTIRELVAFQALFPVRHYGDTRDPRRGRYYRYDIGDAVRVIVTDFRSPDRSNATDPDGPNKTMFGVVQLQWIFDSLDTTKVNILVNETSWLADPNDVPGGKRTDKPWTYFHEQRLIANHVTSGGYRVVWIGGDRHYVGYLRGRHSAGDGVFNTRGGWPCYISSGMSKNSLPLQPGELMNWQFGANEDGRAVCQYLRLTLSYDAPTRVVTLGAEARAVLDTSQPQSDWRLQHVPGGSAVDTWTL